MCFVLCVESWRLRKGAVQWPAGVSSLRPTWAHNSTRAWSHPIRVWNAARRPVHIRSEQNVWERQGTWVGPASDEHNNVVKRASKAFSTLQHYCLDSSKLLQMPFVQGSIQISLVLALPDITACHVLTWAATPNWNSPLPIWGREHTGVFSHWNTGQTSTVTRARSELESELGKKNSITMALAKSTTLASTQKAAASRFGDTHAWCLYQKHSNLEEGMGDLERKPGPRVWIVRNWRNTMQRLLKKLKVLLSARIMGDIFFM